MFVCAHLCVLFIIIKKTNKCSLYAYAIKYSVSIPLFCFRVVARNPQILLKQVTFGVDTQTRRG
jgi:hypothetical protein